jgi:23S rRNA (cytosine1962-C5)-methyltransferase
MSQGQLQTYLNEEGLKHWRSGHPWLTPHHLAKGVHLPKVPGAFFLGGSWFLLSPASHLRLRRFGLRAEEGPVIATVSEFQKYFREGLEKHLATLFDLKKQMVQGDGLFRWIFGDADGYPGFVVDVFEDTLVCEILSAPIELFWPALQESLEATFTRLLGQQPRRILPLRHHSIRSKEGLILEDLQRSSERHWYLWNGLHWSMDPGGAQKTGAYLDQRMNHQRAAFWASEFKIAKAFDVCCYEGGFGLHLLKAGVAVTGVDTSASALEIYRANAEHNDLSALLHLEKQDAFSFLQALHRSAERAEMIVLDPPPFAPASENKDSALRGFHDLNKRAVQCLRPNGLLVSCSCSHALGVAEMKKAFRRIALETGRELRVLEIQGASPDHTRSLAFPEGDYLTAFFIAVT